MHEHKVALRRIFSRFDGLAATDVTLLYDIGKATVINGIQEGRLITADVSDVQAS